MPTENIAADFSGITMNVSKADLVNAMLPTIISALVANPVLLSKLTNAVNTKQLQQARTTGSVNGRYGGSTQTGSATRINTTSSISR